MSKKVATHGGARLGAGRKPSGLVTERVRVPVEHKEVVVSFLERLRRSSGADEELGQGLVEHLGRLREGSGYALQMYEEVSCGSPSTAQDWLQDELSLDELLVDRNHRQATFMVRARGDSMAIGPAGIQDRDTLVVDRALTAKNGSVVIAIIAGGNATCKRLYFGAAGVPFLKADNPHYADRIFAEGEQIEEVWGVVRYCLHNLL